MLPKDKLAFITARNKNGAKIQIPVEKKGNGKIKTYNPKKAKPKAKPKKIKFVVKPKAKAKAKPKIKFVVKSKPKAPALTERKGVKKAVKTTELKGVGGKGGGLPSAKSSGEGIISRLRKKYPDQDFKLESRFGEKKYIVMGTLGKKVSPNIIDNLTEIGVVGKTSITDIMNTAEYRNVLYPAPTKKAKKAKEPKKKVVKKPLDQMGVKELTYQQLKKQIRNESGNKKVKIDGSATKEDLEKQLLSIRGVKDSGIDKPKKAESKSPAKKAESSNQPTKAELREFINESARRDIALGQMKGKAYAKSRADSTERFKNKYMKILKYLSGLSVSQRNKLLRDAIN